MVKFYGHYSATKQNQFRITVGFSQWLIQKKKKKKKKSETFIELITDISRFYHVG